MKHIPNLLSVFRIVLIPFLVWQLMARNFTIAAVLLVVSGITDFLDGFLARRFGWVSDIGKVLDPISDKLTQVAVCVSLIIVFPTYWYFFAALLVKELVMLVLGSSLLKNKVEIQGARWFGKVVTTLFYVIMIALLFFPGMPHALVLALLCLVTVCAFAAGIMYIPEYRRYRRQMKDNKAETPAQTKE